MLILILLAATLAAKFESCEEPSKMENGNYYIKVVKAKDVDTSEEDKFQSAKDGKGPFLVHDAPKNPNQVLGLNVKAAENSKIPENAVFFVEGSWVDKGSDFDFRILRIFSQIENQEYMLTINQGSFEDNGYFMMPKNHKSLKKRTQSDIVLDYSFQYGIQSKSGNKMGTTYALKKGYYNGRRVRLHKTPGATQIYLENRTYSSSDDAYFCFQKVPTEDKNVKSNKNKENGNLNNAGENADKTKGSENEENVNLNNKNEDKTKGTENEENINTNKESESSLMKLPIVASLIAIAFSI